MIIIIKKGCETMLTEGMKAPTFKLFSQSNDLVSLSDYAGKKVVVYFYPKDDTPGCTAQACHYRDYQDEFHKRNVTVIGISKDSVQSHQKFLSKFNLNFTLLADPETKVIQEYGVWKEKTLYGKKYMGVVRTTFIINETGKIVKVFDNVDPNTDVEKVISFIDSM